MEFTISTTGTAVRNRFRKEYEKYGFEFKEGIVNDYLTIKKCPDIITLNSLEELIQFCDDTGEEVIINETHLEIYNDYRY